MSEKTQDPKAGSTNAQIFRLGSYFPFQLAMVSSVLRDALGSSCVAEGVGINDWRVMTMIANKPGIVASDVVLITLLNEVSVHRSIKKMIGLDLVERLSAGGDKRQKPLQLTSAGQEVFGRLIPEALKLERQVLDILPEEEREIVLRGILQLFTQLNSSDWLLSSRADAN